MRLAVLIKQVPVPEDLRLVDGRLDRGGAVEVNAYCRRANAKGVELAGRDGEVVVFTMGPPTAADALREMIACGATRGVHLVDPLFAGADTLSTARVLASALRAEGPFDLILCGLNSVDADTGQVGPEVAALLALPFAPGIYQLELVSGGFRARLETDDGYIEVDGPLPAVLSCAERLISPSKAGPAERAAVPDEAIKAMSAADLGLAEHLVGTPGSPTQVGPVRMQAPNRRQLMCSSVQHAVGLLVGLGAFECNAATSQQQVVASASGDGPEVWCFVEPHADGSIPSMVGEAAELALGLDGSVTVLTPEPVPLGLGGLGAQRVLAIPKATEPEQWAQALSRAAAARRPWALLLEATRLGRSVASAVAAENDWGLTGDAVDFELRGSRLAAWKPAFGGALVALIESSSPVQIVTIRPGAFRSRIPRRFADPIPEVLPAPGPARIRTTARVVTDTDRVALLRAERVIGVGSGVQPEEYPLVEKLCRSLGAELAATRKVTDEKWLPRSRQVGLTGHSIAPRLYIALGIGGKYNHTIGIRHAGFVLAVNSDPNAPIFDHADVGIVGEWRPIVEEMIHTVDQRLDVEAI